MLVEKVDMCAETPPIKATPASEERKDARMVEWGTMNGCGEVERGREVIQVERVVDACAWRIVTRTAREKLLCGSRRQLRPVDICGLKQSSGAKNSVCMLSMSPGLQSAAR